MKFNTETIGEFLIRFIDQNQTRNWDAIFKSLAIFLILFWGCICLWVYFDARTRYERKLSAVLSAVFVLIFNIPALITYVVLRPEHTKEDIKLLQMTGMIPINLLNFKKTEAGMKLNLLLEIVNPNDGTEPKVTVKLNNQKEIEQLNLLDGSSQNKILENNGEQRKLLEAENVEIVEEKETKEELNIVEDIKEINNDKEDKKSERKTIKDRIINMKDKLKASIKKMNIHRLRELGERISDRIKKQKKPITLKFIQNPNLRMSTSAPNPNPSKQIVKKNLPIAKSKKKKKNRRR